MVQRISSRSRRLAGLLLGAIAVGGGLWCARASAPSAEPAAASVPAKLAASRQQEHEESLAIAAKARAAYDPAEAAAMEARSKATLQGFLDDGWSQVEGDQEPPDTQVENLDPAALRDREPELRRRLAATNITAEHVGRAVHIALHAKNEGTRIAAIRAISDVKGAEADEALMRIYENLEGDNERGFLVGRLGASNLGDHVAEWMVRQIADPDTKDAHKDRFAHQLVFTGLHRYEGRPEEFMPQLMDQIPAGEVPRLKRALRSYLGGA